MIRTHFTKKDYQEAIKNIDRNNSDLVNILIKEKAISDIGQENASKMTKKQLNKKIKNWASNNKDIVDKIKNDINNAIPLLNNNEISKILNMANESHYLMSSTEVKPKAKYKTIDFEKAYSQRISTDFFEYINQITKTGTVKKQTGSSLIKNTQKIDEGLLYQYTGKGVKINPYELANQWSKIKKDGKFMSFDIETLGGVNEFGQQAIDFMTEFSFGEIDYKTGELNTDKVFGSIVGIQKGTDVHKDVLKVLDEIDNHGYITGRHKVIAERLMKAGHSSTKYEQVSGKNGIFKYTQFAGDDVIGGYDSKTARKGLESLIDIGEKQSAYTVNYKGKSIFAWEKELIQGLESVSGKNGLTAVGYNSASFDIPSLKNIVNRGILSNNAKSLIPDIDKNLNHFDLLAAMRLSNKTDEIKDLYEKGELKKFGTTSLQQESLIKKFFPNFYNDKTSHVAATDTEGLGLLMSQKNMLGKETFVDTIMSGLEDYADPLKIKGNSQQLFYAKNSIGIDAINKSGMMSFVDDPFTEEIRTTTGLAIKNGKARKEFFGQWPVQRGVSYTIENIREHSMSNDWAEEIKNTHPDLNVSKLITLRMSPVGGDNLKSNASLVLVGTKEQVTEMFQKNLLLTGDKLGTDSYLPLEGKAGEIVENLMSSTVIENGEIVGKKFHTIQRQLDESSKMINTETAARARREFSLSKENKILNIINDMKLEAANRGVNYDSNFRKQMMQEMMAKSGNVSKSVASNISLTSSANSVIKSFHEYNGKKASREAIDQVFGSIEYSASLEKIMQPLVSMAEKNANGNKSTEDYLLKAYFNSFVGEASKYGIDSNKAINNESHFIKNMDMHKYELDISSIAREESNNILTLNLQNSNYNLADKIREARGGKPFLTQQERVKEIAILGKKLKVNIDLNNDTEEVAINKILSPLKENRKRDALSGRITDVKRMDVSKASPLSKLTDEQISEITDKVFKSVNTPMEINSSSARDMAELFFDQVSSDDLSKYEYNKKQIDTILHFRDLRKQDTINFLDDMFTGIKNSGADVSINSKSRTMSVIHNGKSYPIPMIRDIFKDGRFYTEIGRNRIESPAGFFETKKGSIKLMSAIGGAHEKGYGKLKNVLPRAAKNGEFVEVLNRYMKDISESIRENSAIDRGDFQDVKSIFHFKIEDVISNLNDYNAKGIFDDVEFSQDSEMRKILGKELNIKRINFKDRKLLYDNAGLLLEKVALHENMDSRAIEYARSFGFGNKNTDGFMGTVDRVSGMANAYSPDKRGIDNQDARTIALREDDIEKAINDSIELNELKAGKSIYKPLEHSYYRGRLSGSDTVYNSHITANSLTMSNEKLRDIVNNMDDIQLANGVTAKDILTGSHLDEGAALGNPQVLDKIFKTKNSMQKVNIQKMIDVGFEQIEDLDKITNSAPKINFNPDGTISFEYNSGIFVKKQDGILKIKGLEGGTPDDVFAKYDGVMKLGAFTKNQSRLASEADINRILNAKAKIINEAVNPRIEAFNVLKEVFDLNIYINPLDVNTHRKAMISGLEKNTVSYLALGVGDSGNSVIRETLESLGLKKGLGTVVGSDYIKSLKDKDLSKSLFSSWINGVSGKKISHAEIENIISEKAGVSPSKFADMLFEERYLLWNTLEKRLQDNGIAGDKFIHYISDNREAFKKHSDVSKYIEDVSTRLLEKFDPTKAHGILSEAIPGLTLSEDNKFIIPENTKINSDKLKNIVNDNDLRVNTPDYEIAPVSVSHVSSHYDMGPSSYSTDGRHRLSKPMRITDRHLNMMEMDIYDEEAIKRIRAGLDDDVFNNAFSHMLDSNGNISEHYKNMPVNQSVIKQIEAERMVRYGVGPDDNLLIKNGEIVKTKGVHKRIEQLNNNGIYLDKSIEQLTNKGYKNISLSAVEDLYSASRMEAAREWNNGSIGSIESMEKLGFSKSSLSEIDLSKKMNSGYDQSGFEKNLLIDLHDDRLGNRQIYTGEKDRYLALPFEPQKYYSDEEAMSEIRSKVTRLQSLNAQAVDGSISDLEKAEIQSKMLEVKQDINSAISKELTGKKKGIAALSTVNLTNSARFTASGHQIFGNETSSYYKNLEFDGINLVDAAKKGTEYDYAFAGRDYFNKTYLSKSYLREVGLSEEEMIERLKTKGSMELLIREPADYKRTLGLANVYLDDSIKGDKIRVGAAGVLSKGGDFDGDAFGVANFRADAEILQKNGKWKKTKINNATYEMLLEKGTEVRLDNENVFKDAKAAMHMYSIENKAYSSLRKAVNDNYDSLDDFIVDRYSIAGELWPNNIGDMNPTELKQSMQRYNSINIALSEKHNISKDSLIASQDYRKMATDYIDEMSLSGAIDRDEALKSIAVGSHMQADILERGIKASKLAAGESNFFLYNMKRTMNIMRKSGIDISSTESNIIQQISLGIQENFLAPKNVSEIDENILEDLKEGISSMFGTNGRDRNPSVMEDFLRNSNIMERKELKVARDLTGLSIDDQISMFSNFGSKADINPSFSRYLRQGIVDNGIGASENLVTSGKGFEMIDDTISMIKNTLRSEGLDSRIEESNFAKARERLSQSFNTEWQAPSTGNYKRTVRESMDKLSHQISKSKLTGKNLAFGALGLAGAAMIAGFVGGNPSRPATTEAQAQDNQDAYVVPSMIDQEIANMPSTNHGYIININASTRKGRKQAIEAIQQAAMSGQNSSVNLSMNITDSYGRPSDENVRRSIERAFS